jgi:stage V sporulation protein B
MGLFQLISPVYSLVILTLTSGISIAVSKMVAEEYARHHTVNLRRITVNALVLVVTAGIAVSAVIYLNIDFIVNYILKDSRTYYSMLLLIPCIPVIAAASALKGYFYGIQDVTPTAISQIAEQVVKIGLVILTAAYFLNLGLEYACALATVGMAMGEIANLFVLCISYSLKKRKERAAKSKDGFLRKRLILWKLLEISLPVSSNRFITSIMSAIEYILIPRMLILAGMDHQSSIELYGKLGGMALPLIFFPSLVTMSLATTLVPAISEAISLKNFKTVNYRISKSIQITLILGIIFSVIFMSYPDDIGNLVYRNQDIGELLYLLSFSCIFIYLNQTMLGILNGLGKQGISLRNTIIGSAIRIGFVYFLIPVYGIKSYVWGIIISFTCVCVLNMITIAKTTGLALNIRNWIVMPGIVGIFMLLIGRYIQGFAGIFSSGQALTTVIAVTVNFLIALSLMFAAGVLQIDEITRLFRNKRHRNNVKS